MTAPTPEAPAAAPVPETVAPQTFSLEYVQELRQEAAKHRTDKNTAVEAAKAASKADFDAQLAVRDTDFTELQGKFNDSESTLAKIKAAVGAGVPSDKLLGFAELLKGTTEDEIKASAQSAKQLLGITTSVLATDPTQGSGGGPLPLNGDPLLIALKGLVGAR